jgi:flagellar motor protein MotB
MARKKRAPCGPNKAYLVSFGDTMTALLAFFIVLNSLATEQTGADMHSGTGSFLSVGESAGLAGMFSSGKSAYPMQMEAASPLYIVSDGETEDVEQVGNGPDKDGDASLIRDREQDDLERFLLEMEEFHKPREGAAITGEVAFDRMAALPRTGTLVDQKMKADLLRFATTIRRAGYELEIRVWATTPAPSAWQRAAEQAAQLNADVVGFLKIDQADEWKVTATASPWHSSDIKRPAVSFLLRRVQ